MVIVGLVVKDFGVYVNLDISQGNVTIVRGSYINQRENAHGPW